MEIPLGSQKYIGLLIPYQPLIHSINIHIFSIRSYSIFEKPFDFFSILMYVFVNFLINLMNSLSWVMTINWSGRCCDYICSTKWLSESANSIILIEI